MIPRTERRRAVFRATSALGALTAGAAGLALAVPADAVAASGTVPYTCTTVLGPHTVTQSISLTVPASVTVGGTIAIGAIQVNPGAFTPVITTPVALNTTVQDTLTLTVTSSGGGSAVVDVVGAASAKQSVPAGGSPTNGAFANTKAITLPPGLAAGTLTWKADKQVLTADTGATTAGGYGVQATNCVLGSGANPVLGTSTATGGSPGGGATTTTTTAGSHPSTSSSSTSSNTARSTATTSGSTGGTAGTDAPASDATSSVSTLPHTGFNGLWLFGGMAGAAVLGGGGLYLTRRRAGHS